MICEQYPAAFNDSLRRLPPRATTIQESPMSFEATGVIDIPDSVDTLYDHGAFEPRSRRVFVAHTARDRVEVIDHDSGRHLASLDGFPEAAGVVAEEGQ